MIVVVISKRLNSYERKKYNYLCESQNRLCFSENKWNIMPMTFAIIGKQLNFHGHFFNCLYDCPNELNFSERNRTE